MSLIDTAVGGSMASKEHLHDSTALLQQLKAEISEVQEASVATGKEDDAQLAGELGSKVDAVLTAVDGAIAQLDEVTNGLSGMKAS